MGYNDDATLALKLCGTICLIRACMYTIYPETLTSIIGYPPAPAAGGWGKKAGNGPSEEDVLSVIISVQFYGLVQGGIAGLCLSTARVGHPYTMSVVSTVLGTLFFVLCVYASSVLGKEGLEQNGMHPCGGTGTSARCARMCDNARLPQRQFGVRSL